MSMSSSCALRSSRTMFHVTAAAAGMLFLLACCCCCLLPTAAIDAEPFMSMDALSSAFQDKEGGRSLPLGTAEAQALGASPLNNACPESCDDIFPLLQSAVRGKVQDVEIQVRGEPKSGTGMLAEWAWEALAHVCLYLQRLYGKSSCSIAWLTKPDNPSMPGYPHSIVFQPALGKNDTTPPLCPCDSIRVARIKLTAGHKHELPVSPDCSWHRTPGTTSGKDRVCTPVDKSPVVNGQSLWDCVRNNQCKYLDDRLQLAVLRHPGAVTVSAYYQFRRIKMLRADNEPDQNPVVDINTFFLAHLAAVTKWISVRYMVFSELLPQNQTEIFFFEDAISDPVDWHRRFYSFAGINLPPPMVHRAAEIAQNGRESHNDTSLASEQTAFTANSGRSFRDELKPDTLAYMDSVLHIWLPSDLLEKFGSV